MTSSTARRSPSATSARARTPRSWPRSRAEVDRVTQPLGFKRSALWGARLVYARPPLGNISRTSPSSSPHSSCSPVGAEAVVRWPDLQPMFRRASAAGVGLRALQGSVGGRPAARLGRLAELAPDEPATAGKPGQPCRRNGRAPSASTGPAPPRAHALLCVAPRMRCSGHGTRRSPASRAAIRCSRRCRRVGSICSILRTAPPASALPLHGQRHHAGRAGHQRDCLARAAAAAQEAPHDGPDRVRRRVDHGRGARNALVLPRAGRSLARSVGGRQRPRISTSRSSTQGAKA